MFPYSKCFNLKGESCASMSFSIYCKFDNWTLNPFGPLNLYLNCVYFMNMDTIYSCHYKADVAQLKR